MTIPLMTSPGSATATAELQQACKQIRDLYGEKVMHVALVLHNASRLMQIVGQHAPKVCVALEPFFEGIMQNAAYAGGVRQREVKSAALLLAEMEQRIFAGLEAAGDPGGIFKIQLEEPQ